MRFLVASMDFEAVVEEALTDFADNEHTKNVFQRVATWLKDAMAKLWAKLGVEKPANAADSGVQIRCAICKGEGIRTPKGASPARRAIRVILSVLNGLAGRILRLFSIRCRGFSHFKQIRPPILLLRKAVLRP